MIKIFYQPQPYNFPKTGGVRTHLIKLYQHLQDKVEFVHNATQADILHVESSYPIPIPSKKVLYVCHGGFVPPIKEVYRNLGEADKVVSVAKWLIPKFLVGYKHKTTVIPNGVDLSDFQKRPTKGYLLYAKLWDYYFEDVLFLAQKGYPIVTTFWPKDLTIPFNVKYIGSQSHDRMKKWIEEAGVLLSTGSEVNPIMVLEAWAAGVPVVGKDFDGNAELGTVLYNDNIEEQLELVMSNREYYSKLVYDKVQQYQWKDIVLQYLDEYNSLI